MVAAAHRRRSHPLRCDVLLHACPGAIHTQACVICTATAVLVLSGLMLLETTVRDMVTVWFRCICNTRPMQDIKHVFCWQFASVANLLPGYLAAVPLCCSCWTLCFSTLAAPLCNLHTCTHATFSSQSTRVFRDWQVRASAGLMLVDTAAGRLSNGKV